MSNEQQPPQAKEILLLRGKLNALSAIIRLGHDAFTKNDFQQWAFHVVNNSVLALPYFRSSLFDMRDGGCRLASVSGLPEAKPESEYALQVIPLAKHFRSAEKIVSVDSELLGSANASPDVLEAFSYLSKTSAAVCIVPLRSTGVKTEGPGDFLWVVEFAQQDQKTVAPAVLSLLAEHYNESLFMALNRRRPPMFAWMSKWRNWLKPSRIMLIIGVLFLLSTVCVRVRQTVAAEFKLVPERHVICYSPFDGVIAKVHVKSGSTVKKGELILTFETEERIFSLNNAKNEFAIAGAQLDLVQRLSFKDMAKRGQVKLIELQKEKAEIEIKKYDWYLGRSEVRAEADGILDIGDAEKFEGKAVRAGERLFEILETGRMMAEIDLDERNASVLGDDCRVVLYLHTRPEVPLKSKLETVSPKPILTEQKTYCYQLRAGIDKASDNGELIYGMRGVARVSGSRVSFGYYLFRHMVLWYRRL